MTPTAEQQAVIDSDAPAILVSATAGAGKSRVLVERIKRLVRDGANPARIVCITYTTAAAKVLTDRLSANEATPPTQANQMDEVPLAGASQKGAVGSFHSPLGFAGTLHGYLLRLLMSHGALIGLPANLSVVDQEEERALLADALEEVAFRGSLKEVEAEVANGPQPKVSGMTKAGLAAEAFFQRLRADGILTFDLILFHGERLLRAMEAKGVGLGVEHLLVDEVQDCTAQDWRIIEATGVPNIFCVGDFDQAIFAWRSGEKENGFENRCKMATL